MALCDGPSIRRSGREGDGAAKRPPHARSPKKSPQACPLRCAPANQCMRAIADPKTRKARNLRSLFQTGSSQGLAARTRAKFPGQVPWPSSLAKFPGQNGPVTSLQRLRPTHAPNACPRFRSAGVRCGQAILPAVWSSVVGLRGGPVTRLPRVACRIELHKVVAARACRSRLCHGRQQIKLWSGAPNRCLYHARLA